MRFKVGTKVVCTNVYSGGEFDDGDVVTVAQIGCEYDPNCYGAISPHDGRMWYLNEDEVEAATNADHLQELSDEEKAHLLTQVFYQAAQQDNTEQHILEWLRNPVEVEDERPINKQSKHNIKCEHCGNWSGWLSEKCNLNGEPKKYYQRCKKFRWNNRLTYKEDK